MRTYPWHRKAFLRAGMVASALLFATSSASAAPCADLNVARAIYGAGGSAVTPTLRKVASALAGLPAAQRITIFYSDPGACTGYAYFRTPDALTDVSFRYWDENNVEATCEAPQTVIQFAHMGNTPALCPGDVPLPDDARRFVAPVQSVNFITHYDSQYNEISAEALYYVFGFGAGAAGKGVAPWTEPQGIMGRAASSFVAQLIAGSIGVPAASAQVLPANVFATNGQVVAAVDTWGDNTDANQPLGYVSGSNATAGEDAQQIKTLAYQHRDQSCAYLPDSSRQRRDKINVRRGQYWIWTPAWFYSRVDSAEKPVDEDVASLIGWFDGSVTPPGGLDIQKIVVDSGDVPLCAMQAIRPGGDLTAIQSYAPENPCNGWYEHTATGSTDYATCTVTANCAGEDEVCRFGFCEAY